MAIRLETVGPLHVVVDDRPLDRLPARPTHCALLLYLALEREAARDDVVRLLWPYARPEEARTELASALGALTALLGARWARVDGDRIRVAEDLTVDALEFCRAAEAGDDAAARAAYRDGFLSGACPDAGRPFEAWVERWLGHVERLRRRVPGGAAGALSPAAGAAGAGPSGRGHRLRRLGSELHRRRVLPWLLGYVAGAWLLIEATSLVQDEFAWPVDVVPLLFVVLAFGAGTTVILAWYHGAAGWQRVTARELALHGVVVLVLAGVVWSGATPLPTSGPVPAARAITRVAVIPFRDNSEGGAYAGVGRQLGEGVARQLAQASAIDLVASAAIEPLVPVTALDSVARALGLGALVTGSVADVGDSVQVTAELVDAVSLETLGTWSLRYAAGAQTQLVRGSPVDVAERVLARIGQAARERRLAASTEVPGALALYQRAERIANDEAPAIWRVDRARGRQLLNQADRLLAEAGRLDPRWVEPLLLRADVQGYQSALSGGPGARDPARLEAAVATLDRALALTADSARVLERRGRLRFLLAEGADVPESEGLYAAAEADLRAAVRMDPSRPRAWWALSLLTRRQGMLESAYDYAVRAYETDGFLEMRTQVLPTLMLSALDLERLDEAQQWYARGRAARPLDMVFPQNELLVLASLPDPSPAQVAAAWAVVDTMVALGYPENRAQWRAYGGLLVASTLAAAGRADSAEAVIGRSAPPLADAEPQMQAAGAYFEAHARLVLGQRDRALERLRHYVALLPARAESLASDWWWRDLWDEPAFQRLVRTPLESTPPAGS